jgi:hypothetical protein
MTPDSDRGGLRTAHPVSVIAQRRRCG